MIYRRLEMHEYFSLLNIKRQIAKQHPRNIRTNANLRYSLGNIYINISVTNIDLSRKKINVLQATLNNEIIDILCCDRLLRCMDVYILVTLIQTDS